VTQCFFFFGYGWSCTCACEKTRRHERNKKAQQRFENVDPTDRVFFDGVMYEQYALNVTDGVQGPTYLGAGCMFRRLTVASGRFGSRA
jgi:hypothetical protein